MDSAALGGASTSSAGAAAASTTADHGAGAGAGASGEHQLEPGVDGAPAAVKDPALVVPDPVRLGSCMADVQVAIAASRTALQGKIDRTGNHAIYMARVRDLMSTLAGQVELAVKAFSVDETAMATAQGRAALADQKERFEKKIADIRAANADLMQRHTAEMEGKHKKELHEKVSAIAYERDILAAEKRAREEELLMTGTGEDGEPIAHENELAAARSEASAARKQAKVANEKNQKLLDAKKHAAAQWAEAIGEIVNACKSGESSLVRVFDAKRNENQDPKRPWRVKKGTATEQLNKLLEMKPEPHDQLTALSKSYEEAIADIEAERAAERAAAEAALADAKKATSDAERYLKEERRETRIYNGLLYGELQSSETLAESMGKKIADLQSELAAVEEVAREKASVESRRLQKELAKEKDEVTKLAAEIVALNDTGTETVERHKQEVASLRATQRRMQERLTACAKALSKTQAAGRSGGYYFCSGAPSMQWTWDQSFLKDLPASPGGKSSHSPGGSPGKNSFLGAEGLGRTGRYQQRERQRR